MIDRLLDAPPRLGGTRLLAIDGPSGSGKSTLAARLVANLAARGVRTALVPTDHFATWDNPVAWWPDLVEGVLVPLSRGGPGRYRRMVWEGGAPRPGPWITVDPPEVLVLEGVSAGRRSAARWTSLLVWVEDADPAARLERAVARDGESCRAELSGWQRFEAGWFAVDGTRGRAGVTLTYRPGSG